MATGYAIARGEPAFVNLHTAAGLGNAINAIANARDCRAPLVVVVGQQDRRQIAFEPFLTGRALERWPASTRSGASCRSAPRTCRARSPGRTTRPRPAGDRRWSSCRWGTGSRPPTSWPPGRRTASCARTRCTLRRSPELAELWSARRVAGAGRGRAARQQPTAGTRWWRWPSACAARSGRSRSARRAGFPQDHPLFAGHLPWQRRLMRDALARHDVVLAVGTNAFRLYIFERAGRARRGRGRASRCSPTTRPRPTAARASSRSSRPWGPRAALAASSSSLPRGTGTPPGPSSPRAAAPAGGRGAAAPRPRPRRARRAAAGRGVLVEETPSSQPELISASRCGSRWGSSARANGGLGFGLAGSIGLRMGLPDRPVRGGARRRLDHVRDPGAVERRPLRRRRAAGRDGQRRATR